MELKLADNPTIEIVSEKAFLDALEKTKPFFGLRADTKREQASSYPPYVRAACLTRCATIYFSRSKASAVSNISM